MHAERSGSRVVRTHRRCSVHVAVCRSRARGHDSRQRDRFRAIARRPNSRPCHSLTYLAARAAVKWPIPPRRPALAADRTCLGPPGSRRLPLRTAVLRRSSGGAHTSCASAHACGIALTSSLLCVLAHARLAASGDPARALVSSPATSEARAWGPGRPQIRTTACRSPEAGLMPLPASQRRPRTDIRRRVRRGLLLAAGIVWAAPPAHAKAAREARAACASRPLPRPDVPFI